MSRATPPGSGAEPPKAPRTPDPYAQGIACVDCGLRNDPHARVCLACGLPLARPGDPIRGVASRRPDLPSERGSGLGATIGLVVGIGLLVLAGTLVVRGGDLLSGGGRLTDPIDTPRPTAATTVAPTSVPASTPVVGASAVPGTAGTDAAPAASEDAAAASPTPAAPVTPPTRIAFTCEEGGITDPNRSRWHLARFLWGERDAWDRITFELDRRGGRARRATDVTVEWIKANEAVRRFTLDRPIGRRVLLVTFDGPVDIDVNTFVDPSTATRTVGSLAVFMDDEGTLRAVAGISGDGCARLIAPEWGKAGPDPAAKVYLDIESK